MRDALTIRNLSISYDGRKTVDGVSLSVNAGSIIGIVGESGSGKSTILNAVMGTLPHNARIESGSISLGDTDLLDVSERDIMALRGAKIGMIFQNPHYALCPTVKIWRHFKDALRAHGMFDKAGSRATVLELLAKLDLDQPERILASYPFELSGGMCQRVAIALACILHPRFVLADEPTSALDVMTQLQVVSELERVSNDFGTGIILVTHNIGVVAKIADQVGVCHAGRIVEFGATGTVLHHPQHPYTRCLIDAIPQINHRISPPIADDGARARPHTDGCRFADACPRKDETCRAETSGNEQHWVLCSKGFSSWT